MNMIEAANEMIREQKRTDLLDNNGCKVVHSYSKGIVPVREVYNVGLLSSIGCIGRCSFRSYSKADIFQFDIETLIQGLQFIYKNKILTDKIIWFYDYPKSSSSLLVLSVNFGLSDENIEDAADDYRGHVWQGDDLEYIKLSGNWWYRESNCIYKKETLIQMRLFRIKQII